MEVIIAVAIMVGILLVIGLLAHDVFDFSSFFQGSFESQQEINQTLQTIIPEVRSMTRSAAGSYAIETAASSTLTFFSDIEGDGVVERVRYFVSSTTLWRGIVKPTGSPPVYNPASETTRAFIHNLVLTASSTFLYYDESFNGTQSPLAFPVTINSVRLVEMIVRARTTEGGAQMSAELFLTPRNLRTNF